MPSPFAAGLGALFNGPGSVACTYVPVGGDAPFETRVILVTPDTTANFGEGRIIQPTRIVMIRRSDVPEPRDGDVVATADQSYAIFGEPMLDAEGVTWECQAEDA